MRLTTKIIIGIILSIFALSLLHIIAFSFTDRKNYSRSYPNRSIVIPQTNNTGINIESYRVIVLASEQFDMQDRFYCHFPKENNGLLIHPAATIDEDNKLFIPEALNGFITTQTNNDTLILKIKIDALSEKYGNKDDGNTKYLSGIKHALPISGLNLYLHTSNAHVINRLSDLQTQINNMKSDSIVIYSSGEIVINDCKANVMIPNSIRKISVTNSVAGEITLDLDSVDKWEIYNSTVKTRNFTGSKRNHNLVFSENEHGKINWLPKNKDAELNIRFKVSSAQISYQTH